MSKFFATGSSSESEDSQLSGSESDGFSSDDQAPVKLTADATATTGNRLTNLPRQRGATRTFMFDDDSDDEGPRVVKSAKEKAVEEMQNTVHDMRRAQRSNDWNTLKAELDKLLKQQHKQSNKSFTKVAPPAYFIGALVALDKHLAATLADKKLCKSLSKTNNKSLSQVRKQMPKLMEQYASNIATYLDNPDALKDADEEAERKEAQRAEEEAKRAAKAQENKPKRGTLAFWLKKPGSESDSDTSSSEDEWDPDADSEDDDDEAIARKQAERQRRKAEKEKEKADKAAEKDKAARAKQQRRAAAAADKAAGLAEGAAAAAEKLEDEKKKEKEKEWTDDDIDKRLRELLSVRGRRGTSRTEQVAQLVELLSKCKTPLKQMQLHVHVIGAHFDVVSNAHDYMPTPLWRTCINYVQAFLALVDANPEIKVAHSEASDVAVAMAATVTEGEAVLDAPAAAKARDARERKKQRAIAASAASDAASKSVSCNLRAFVERLDDEWTKSMRATDHKTPEYVERLRDEQAFLKVADRVQSFYQASKQMAPAVRVAVRRLQRIYYVPAHVPGLPDHDATITTLAHFVYQHGDVYTRTTAALCQIYAMALRDRFHEARDLMLMSHLQDTIHAADIATMIHFNRAMVQLGLAAFRGGHIADAHACLSEVCAGGRIKELLAQGMGSRYQDRTPEQEKAEKRRQTPFHQHINLDQVEAVHLITAMLLEVPNMAAGAYDVKRKVISKPFRRWLEYYEKQAFTGEPENTRDTVIAAASALTRCEWSRAWDLIAEMKFWHHMRSADTLKAMTQRKLQEAGLRTYLFTFSRQYEAVSKEHLASMFALPADDVHRLLSKMIISDELHASWDQPTGAIILHRVEPSPLQARALQLADKAAGMVESNERVLDSKTGGYGYKFDHKGGDQHQRHQKQRRPWHSRPANLAPMRGGDRKHHDSSKPVAASS